MKSLFNALTVAAVLFFCFVGVGYAMGWIEIQNEADRTTLEINKSEASESADEALETAGNLLDEAADAVKSNLNESKDDGAQTPEDDSATEQQQ